MIKIISNKKMKELIEKRGLRLQVYSLNFDNTEGSLSAVKDETYGLMGSEDLYVSVKSVEEFLNKKKEKSNV